MAEFTGSWLWIEALDTDPEVALMQMMRQIMEKGMFEAGLDIREEGIQRVLDWASARWGKREKED